MIGRQFYRVRGAFLLIGISSLLIACSLPTPEYETQTPTIEHESQKPTTEHEDQTPTAEHQNPIPTMKEPLITNLYTADPSAHVFDDKLYLYPSHDLDNDSASSREGDQFNMVDYHIFSLENMQTPVTDHGQALHIEDVPWAQKQMWAPDAAYKDGTYYFYFPAKDKDDIFRIGVATSDSPAGPFVAQPEPISGSFSIDPAVFVDDDDQAYIYFGGLWGGQLERWRTGSYDENGTEPAAGEPALGPKIARLTDDMLEFDGPIQEITILDEEGNPLLAKDTTRRFFEGAWVHKYNGLYYLSYSTGDTHYLVYATSESPTGPFQFQGRLLEPVLGWTTHHSIVEFQGKWYLFYHDSELSDGVTHKRNIKYVELQYEADGSIPTIEP